MSKRIFLATVAICVSSCAQDHMGSGGATAEPSVPSEQISCGRTSQVYAVRFFERQGGTCGPLPDRLVPVSIVEPGPLCEGGYDYLDDCTLSVSLECPNEDTTRLRVSADIRWSSGQDIATGQWAATLSSATGSTICASRYDIIVRPTLY